MVDITWGQYKAAGRHALSYAAGAATAAAAFGLLSQAQSADVLSGLNKIGDGLSSVADGVMAIAGVLAPLYAAYKAAHSASAQEQLKTVAAMPEVKGIVTTPAVAEATPSDKVVSSAKDLETVAAKTQ